MVMISLARDAENYAPSIGLTLSHGMNNDSHNNLYLSKTVIKS